ncbi:multiubiquitin domain-containing protein [Rhodanobacter umsongensis]
MTDIAQDQHEHGHPKTYHFFVDGKKYDSEQSSLTGADVKRIAGVNPTYQLFQEEEGDEPDRPVADSTGIDLSKGTKHFFAVPPATFGDE